jgi:hypothetical protein
VQCLNDASPPLKQPRAELRYARLIVFSIGRRLIFEKEQRVYVRMLPVFTTITSTERTTPMQCALAFAAVIGARAVA